MTDHRSTAAARLLTSQAQDELLEALPLAEGSVVAGSPRSAHRTLLPDNPTVGVWELTPGTVTDIEIDEVFVVVAGAGSLSFDDGSVLQLIPGTVVRLVAGDSTTWRVTQTLRKVYLLQAAHSD